MRPLRFVVENAHVHHVHVCLFVGLDPHRIHLIEHLPRLLTDAHLLACHNQRCVRGQVRVDDCFLPGQMWGLRPRALGCQHIRHCHPLGTVLGYGLRRFGRQAHVWGFRCVGQLLKDLLFRPRLLPCRELLWDVLLADVILSIHHPFEHLENSAVACAGQYSHDSIVCGSVWPFPGLSNHLREQVKGLVGDRRCFIVGLFLVVLLLPCCHNCSQFGNAHLDQDVVRDNIGLDSLALQTNEELESAVGVIAPLTSLHDGVERSKVWVNTLGRHIIKHLLNHLIRGFGKHIH
mmetsp:Transcript_81237/g.143246  ORF Transcript_81237/g.143246 Transcript_81237/m.143246 type:complete len:290 (-) Transcript_81237:839-1708(-)